MSTGVECIASFTIASSDLMKNSTRLALRPPFLQARCNRRLLVQSATPHTVLVQPTGHLLCMVTPNLHGSAGRRFEQSNMHARERKAPSVRFSSETLGLSSCQHRMLCCTWTCSLPNRCECLFQTLLCSNQTSTIASSTHHS